MRLTVLLAAALLCVVCSTASYARPKHHSVAGNSPSTGCSDPIMRPCGVEFGSGIFGDGINRKSLRRRHFLPNSASKEITHHNITRAARLSPGLARVMAEGASRVVGGRPAGCPHAFCGCGASLHIFGKIVPALNLAANWLRFPRAEPAPGMVAVRRHHVFVLVRHIRGPWWIAHDSNSGRHLTRVHPRSIVGWAIVDPRAGA